jgi:hypothetical protein
MAVGIARPPVTDLVFHFYERPLHPELFCLLAELRVRHARHEVAVRICEAGHVIALRRGRDTLAEVTADAHQVLPTHKRRIDRRLCGCRHETRTLECGITYQTSFQLERLEPDIFDHCHEELAVDARTADLAYEFPAAGRFGHGPLSLMRVESTRDSLLVHAFHTFPSSLAVVKTQSLFEL